MAEKKATKAAPKTAPKKKAASAPAAEGDKRCKVEGCKRKYRAKGYCNVHYKKWRQAELPKGRYKICTKEGCRKPRAVGSLCKEHAAGEPAAS